ncbi:uncharacterized protein [Macaca nemestrina]|uniref:uncharacterized protein n=1 Tax=Macaca nemestrina TaxID=9545 RepID=UPI0039B890DE
MASNKVLFQMGLHKTGFGQNECYRKSEKGSKAGRLMGKNAKHTLTLTIMYFLNILFIHTRAPPPSPLPFHVSQPGHAACAVGYIKSDLNLCSRAERWGERSRGPAAPGPARGSAGGYRVPETPAPARVAAPRSAPAAAPARAASARSPRSGPTRLELGFLSSSPESRPYRAPRRHLGSRSPLRRSRSRDGKSWRRLSALLGGAALWFLRVRVSAAAAPAAPLLLVARGPDPRGLPSPALRGRAPAAPLSSWSAASAQRWGRGSISSPRCASVLLKLPSSSPKLQI